MLLLTSKKSVNPALQNYIIAYSEVKLSTTLIINNCFCCCYQNKWLLLLVNSSYLFFAVDLKCLLDGLCIKEKALALKCCFFMCVLVFVRGYEDKLCCINVLSE